MLFRSDGDGSVETPHPYVNNQLYLFRVQSSGVLEWSFDEFEIDILDDGSCGDEVWIFKGDRAPEGPFCGFDSAFNNPDSINYDYYYDNLLDTMPDAIKGAHYSVDNTIIIGLKSKSLVNNWGFKLSFSERECAEGYFWDSDNPTCTIAFEPIVEYPSGLVCAGPDCGESGSGRISQGQLATEWNYLAQLSHIPSGKGCTGTILDSETILTAAECCIGEIADLQVNIGNKVSNAAEPGEFTASVLSRIIHEDYDEITGHSNLCVIKTEDLKMTQPDDCDNCWSTACLPDRSYGIGRSCWTAGWGATSNKGNPSNKLREAGLNIFDRDYCLSHSKASFQATPLESTEFCAGTIDADGDGITDEGPGPCSHDHGGPLVCDDNGAPVIYGAFSRGIGCSKKGQPSVFSDIYANRLWIKSQMAEICPTQAPTPVPFESSEDEHLPAGLVCDETPSGRIVSGDILEDELERWKFLVNIATKKEPERVVCGGTVVNGCHVLTSGSCCWDYEKGQPINTGSYQVGFGNWNVKTSSITPGEFHSEIYAMHIHPEFNPETKAHDLCILQFFPLVEQTTDPTIISSACLPTEHDVDMRQCWTAGWGETKYEASGDHNPVNAPREVPLNIFPHEYCVEKTDSTVLKYDQFCAGVPDHDGDGQADGGDSPCSFDEGNPIICPVDGKPVLYGVTSQGSCGLENAASIFTKTTSGWNSPWIAETLGEECPSTAGQCLFPAFSPVPVTWLGASQTKIMYSTSDAIMASISIPNWRFDFDIRENPYMIFTIFQRKYCGQGFFNAYANPDWGITYKSVMDFGDYYDLQSSYERTDGSLSSLTLQIRKHTVAHQDYPFLRDIKYNKKDQLFLFMGGLSNLDWRGKDPRECFEKMVVGVSHFISFVNRDGDIGMGNPHWGFTV